ncbi:MAG: LamG domain-containing protein, partial [Verrucomicrobiota bacterium]
AISQADFPAFYGISASARPGQVTVDAPSLLDRHRDRLTELKQAIRTELSTKWVEQAKDLPAALERIRATSQERVRLQEELAKVERALSADEFRRRLKADKDAGPAPSHWWTFEQDGRDLVGKLDAKLLGGAVIQNGRLLLDGGEAFAETGPTTEKLTAKTLEAWVALPTLDQRGGGVLTVESLGGGVFDAIVYGEKQRSRWMAGSNNSVRTQNVDGPAETAKPGELIHVAIVYQADGRIALYRNGQPYGAAYAPANEKAGLHAYLAGKSRLLFGRRHTGGGNAFLRGEIEEARLYGFALTAAQIADSFRAGTLRGELAPVATKDEKLDALRAEAVRLRAKLDEINRSNGRLAENFQHEEDPTYPLHAATFLRAGLKPKPAPSPRSEKPDWTLGDQSSASWLRHGNGLDGRFAPGDFRVEPAGADVLKHVLPSGLHSHTLSTKHSAVLTSPRFKVTTNFISVQAMGKGATLRLIPDNYPISTAGGSRFPKASIDSAKPTWITLDTAYRKGSYAYLELTLPEDSTNPDKKVEA